MKILRFEEIVAWQKAKELTLLIYEELINLQDLGFRGQIQRAAVSIMNNISEGFERNTNKEFKYFLYVAKGSCGEVRSMLILGLDLHYINQEASNKLISLSVDISKLLAGLIKTI